MSDKPVRQCAFALCGCPLAPSYAHSKSDILSAYCNAILGPAFASGLRGGGPSTLDIGNWSIVAIRQLVVPAAVPVLVRNACRISGDALFRGGALGSSAGRVVARERPRNHPRKPARPTP